MVGRLRRWEQKDAEGWVTYRPGEQVFCPARGCPLGKLGKRTGYRIRVNPRGKGAGPAGDGISEHCSHRRCGTNLERQEVRVA